MFASPPRALLSHSPVGSQLPLQVLKTVPQDRFVCILGNKISRTLRHCFLNISAAERKYKFLLTFNIFTVIFIKESNLLLLKKKSDLAVVYLSNLIFKPGMCFMSHSPLKSRMPFALNLDKSTSTAKERLHSLSEDILEGFFVQVYFRQYFRQAAVSLETDSCVPLQ